MSTINAKTRSYVREDKGSEILFLEDVIVKRFAANSTVTNPFVHGTQADRYQNELSFYRRANSMGLTFVPKLVSHDDALMNLTIERVSGRSVLEIICSGDFDRDVADRCYWFIKNADFTLANNHFREVSSTIKDIIVNVDDDGMYDFKLVDFETLGGKSNSCIVNSIIDDLVQRVMGIRLWIESDATNGFARRIFSLNRSHHAVCLLFWKLRRLAWRVKGKKIGACGA